MEIKEHTTKELVEELSKREGVERIETPVEGQDEIATQRRDRSYIHDKIHSGPAIILRIID